MKKEELKQITWDDITIDMFERIQKTGAPDEGDELDKIIRILSIVTGVPENEYLNMSFNELNVRVKTLAFLYEKPKERFTGRDYTLNGSEYVLTTSAKQMIAAQYIDYMSMMRTKPNDVVSLLSVVLIPKGYSYNEEYDIEKVKNDIRYHLPYIDALGINFFFAKASEILMRASVACLETKLEKQTKQMNRMIRKERNAVRKVEMMKAVDRIRKCMRGLSSWGK